MNVLRLELFVVLFSIVIIVSVKKIKTNLFTKTTVNQRVKKREGKTQIFGFWAGQSGQIFLAGYIWAVKSSHRWQHLWAKVKI